MKKYYGQLIFNYDKNYFKFYDKQVTWPTSFKIEYFVNTASKSIYYYKNNKKLLILKI